MLEYMLLDILKLTAYYVENISGQKPEIEDQDVKIAMFADKVQSLVQLTGYQTLLTTQLFPTYYMEWFL